ncbi:uncharacterized protein MELLADRAFT_68596 [Melampsora larici-populina 98AG31]|uniref:DUF6589 domain-containing protein n=1 Tax=Melampsora larici-populina (strain 98AG31 / pathotype 3-4-7) TaxID=747676 RepID=F4S7D8_MELLP|nr:uncharacterized protein MELLADRAFT_68596 [Melampsora larici-populina 98AG31]EGF99441.1 hypothetical protein MELLADRAFT_68596 [Melampsora larici-populina 98AG31]
MPTPTPKPPNGSAQTPITPSVHIPKTVACTIDVCDYINKIGFSPKEFMVTFFSSTHEELNSRQRFMKIGLGIKTTRSIVKNLGNLTRTSDVGEEGWEKIILEEASAIVNQQEVMRGYFPAGAFTSSNRITPDYFGEGAAEHRAKQIQTGMPFLHSLIRSKLSLSMKNKKPTDDKEDEHVEAAHPLQSQASTPPGDNPNSGESGIEGALDEDTVLSLENLVFVKPNAASLAGHKIETAKCADEAASIATFLDAMDSADRKPVEVGLFAPSPSDMEHWVLVIKSQLAQALLEFSSHLPGVPEANKLPKLSCRPPPIDQIALHKPNIHFLRMMDAPDSSADGVSRVLDAVMGQTGVDKDEYAKRVLIAAGDVGSNQLLESLRVKRYPPVKALEGIDWVLSIFGGAHTNWNFAKAIWGLHWGDSGNGHDSGVWRSAHALGGEYKKPPQSQDFNSIMRSLQIVHKATLVFILKQVIEAEEHVNWTEEADILRIFDKGHGTDIERLTYRFSNNIPLKSFCPQLRMLMQLLRSLSGHKMVYQPNPNTITDASMKAFLSYAQEHLGNKSTARPPPMTVNVWREGHEHMVGLINADKAAGRSSRFRWGASDVLSSWENPEAQGED